MKDSMLMEFNLYRTINEWVFFRKIPFGMKIHVSVGEIVTPETILASGYVSTTNYIIKMDEYDKKSIVIPHHGQVIRKGDIIMKGKIVSPLDGIVNLSYLSQGRIKIESLPEFVEIHSFINGKVSSIDGSIVYVLSSGVRFFLPCRLGRSTQGKFCFVTDVNTVTVPKEDTVFVADYVDAAFESKSRAIGVKGIVGVGIDTNLVMRRQKEHIPVGSIMGFGTFNQKFDFEKWNGYFCEISKEQNSFTIAINN